MIQIAGNGLELASTVVTTTNGPRWDAVLHVGDGPAGVYIVVVTCVGSELPQPAMGRFRLVDEPLPVSPCPSVGDFYKDIDRSQPTVFRSTNGVWYVNDLAPGGISFGAPGDVPCLHDYNGDGVDDLAVYRPSNETWYVRSYAPSGIPFGVPGDLPIAANYDRDSDDDIAVWRPSKGVWYVKDLAPWGVPYGVTDDIPVPADYDGVDADNIAVWRPSTATWYAHGLYDSGIVFGTPTDIPVPADYNGGGKDDFAVYRPGSGPWASDYQGPETGTWFIDTDHDGIQDLQYEFGGWSRFPVPADYDEDPTNGIQLAYYDNLDQTWHIRGITDGSGLRFGIPGADWPIVRRNS